MYFLKPRNGERKTRRARSPIGVSGIAEPAASSSPFWSGSIFEDSKVPLSKWLLAVYMMCSNKNGVAAYELHRTLGVTQKTAWFMTHRIREAMKAEPLAEMLSGTVVADETAA